LPLLKKKWRQNIFFKKSRAKHVYNATFDATFEAIFYFFDANFDATFFKSGKRGLGKEYYLE